MNVEGRRILITGASRGIGRAIAQVAAGAGATVGANYLSSANEAQLLQEEFPDHIHLFQADVKDPTAVNCMVEEFEKKFGAIDVLINNAGVSELLLFLRQNEESVRLAVETNILGTIYTTQAVLKGMVKQQSGLIVFHSSVAAEQPRSGQSVYAATKSAIEAFSKGIGIEYRRRGIKTVCMRFGPVRTEMYESCKIIERERIEERLIDNSPSTPKEVAEFFMSSILENETLLNGSTITLDRGYLLGFNF